MKIKHAITAICVAMFSFCATAQNCQYEKEFTDDNTGKKVKITVQVVLARLNNNPLYFKAQSIGDDRRFLKMRYYKYNDFYFRDDREVILFLTNGEQVVLNPRVNPNESKESKLQTISSMVIYPLTEEQFSKLRNHPVKNFRYYVATGFVDLPIKDNKQDQLMKILKCID